MSGPNQQQATFLKFLQDFIDETSPERYAELIRQEVNSGRLVAITARIRSKQNALSKLYHKIVESIGRYWDDQERTLFKTQSQTFLDASKIPWKQLGQPFHATLGRPPATTEENQVFVVMLGVQTTARNIVALFQDPHIRDLPGVEEFLAKKITYLHQSMN